jgi:aminopeptidase N
MSNNRRLWSQVITSLVNVKSIFGDVPDVAQGLKKFTVKLVTPALKKLGWEFAPNEEQLVGLLRSTLISQAGGAGDPEVVAEAQRRFKSFVSGEDTSAIHPSLRLSVFRIAVSTGGAEELEAVKKFYASTTSIDGKEVALQSMGSVPTKELANDVLDFSFSPAVAVQDKHSPAVALAANSAQRSEIWVYVKAHWEDKVFPQLSGNKVVLERWLRMALSKYSDFEIEKDIGKFFENKDQKGFDRGLSVIRDNIIGSAKYKERDTEKVREWLKTHGYL